MPDATPPPNASAKPAAGAPLIEARDVTKVYELGDQQVRALDGVSLSIRSGEYVAIMGPSGSGKSTMMNLIGALDVPTTGEMLIDGRDIAAQSADDLAVCPGTDAGLDVGCDIA